MYKVIYLSKEFVEHSCTQNRAVRPAGWVAGLESAYRMWPQIKGRIPDDTPPETKVFHCTDCTLIALAPGKASR